MRPLTFTIVWNRTRSIKEAPRIKAHRICVTKLERFYFLLFMDEMIPIKHDPCRWRELWCRRARNAAYNAAYKRIERTRVEFLMSCLRGFCLSYNTDNDKISSIVMTLR